MLPCTRLRGVRTYTQTYRETYLSVCLSVCLSVWLVCWFVVCQTLPVMSVWAKIATLSTFRLTSAIIFWFTNVNLHPQSTSSIPKMYIYIYTSEKHKTQIWLKIDLQRTPCQEAASEAGPKIPLKHPTVTENHGPSRKSIKKPISTLAQDKSRDFSWREKRQPRAYRQVQRLVMLCRPWPRGRS
jgi:hypothetical protein